MAVDPAGTVTARAGPGTAALDALIAAELDALAADAQALQSQIAVGDIVQAQVLPSNGLTDLVSILGNRVAAALPPALTPGDVVTVQVTGFDGPQILMQMVSNEPGSAAASSAVTASAAPSPSAAGLVSPSSAGLPTLAAAAPSLSATGVSSLSAAGIPTPSATGLPAGRADQSGPGASDAFGGSITAARVAPPVAVFVAASVRPSSGDTAGGNATAPGRDAVATAASASSAASAADPEVAALETRLAVARAGVVPGRFAGSVPATRPGTAPIPPPLVNRGFAAPPPIVTPARFLPAGDGAALQAGASPAGSTSASAAPAAPPAALSSFTDPTTLVRALRLPVTPTNVAAARLALTAPQRLPAALATLERALPQLDDPRVQTLRTLTAFLGKIEPGSPELAGQIAAYVDHVVAGGDAKLTQVLIAQDAVDTAAAAAPPTANSETGQASSAVAASEATVPVVALAQIVEGNAAMASDLKTQLQQLLAAPPAASTSDDLVPAAATALAAVTGVQLATAQAALASPQQISFAVPMWLGNGYAQARIAVDRDAPDGRRAPLDGDNFHIAFVLDTKNLGTVTVDLVTVGRAFSLAVKTADSASAKRFADSLDRLTTRLETLRYTVHAAEATVALPAASDGAAGAGSDAADADPSAAVNLRA